MVKIEEAPGNDPNVSPMYSFGQYLYEEVPEAALYSFGSTETRGLYYFEFADLCDRGEEIITAGLYYAQKHVDFVFLILPRSEWPEYTFQNKGRFWVDAPDYQPDYWAIRKKAYKACDSSDWERVASYDTQFDPFTAKMYGYFYASYALRLNPKSITAAALKKKFAYRLPAETIASAERILDYAYTRSECFSGER